MRILVTGITGQVGAALRRALEGRGEIIAADRNTLDLAKPELLGARLDALAPDLIINPAAYTAVDRAETDDALALTVNATSPGVLARWAAAADVPLIHFSTDYVFDGTGTRPWREDDATGPLSVYGKSKLAGERAIRASGGPHLIIRTSWVYAASGRNFLTTMARLARERAELRVVADQIGAPTSAALIASVVTQVLDGRNAQELRQLFRTAGGLVHVCAAGETSWHGFACEIVAGLRHRKVHLAVERITAVPTAAYPTPAARPANSRLDCGRLIEVFGFIAPDWRQGLDQELDAYVASIT